MDELPVLPPDAPLDPPGETVLDEAARLTCSDRQSTYGPPWENHARTASLWSAYLGVTVSARDVCWMNVLQKASRDRHVPKRDNLVDAAGYARNAEMIEERGHAPDHPR